MVDFESQKEWRWVGVCNVFVHLIIRWAPAGAKITSCLRRCLSGSNWEVL